MLFTRFRSRRRATCRVRSEQRFAESLENRLAMAADLAFLTPSAGNGDQWGTVVVNDGDEAFLQVVSSQTRDLRIADNAGFFNPTYIGNVDGRIDDLYVYNGTVVERELSFRDDVSRFGLPVGYPTSSSPVNQIQFTLPSEGIDTGSRISGTIDLGDDGELIRFENTRNSAGNYTSNFQVLSGPTVDNFIIDRTGSVSSETGSSVTPTSFPQLVLISNVGFPGSTGSVRAPHLEMSYAAGSGAIRITASVGIVEPTAGLQAFNLFDTSAHQYVPGSLSGTFSVDFQELGAETRAPISFQVNTAGGNGIIPISFGNNRSTSIDLGFDTIDPDGDRERGTIRVTGSFDTATGQLLFRTRTSNERENGSPVNLTDQSVPIRLNTVTMGLLDISPNDDGADPQGTTYDYLPTGLTLFPGHNFTPGLTSELVTSGSSISIESPIVADAALSGVVSLSASNVRISAPIRADSAIVVPSPLDSVFQSLTEQLVIEAAVGAPIMDLYLADNESTGGVSRSLFHVTQTGSLSNSQTVLQPTEPANTVLPESINIAVEVEGGDIFIEGEVAGRSQTYTMRSAEGSEVEGPYIFTTNSLLTGQGTGLVRGEAVVVTLANDTLGENGFGAFGTLASEVVLQTEVDRLRVQAGARPGNYSDVPYPYTLSVNENDDLIVDAVAATSDDIFLTAEGKIDLLASLSSLRDITLIAGDSFTVSSPVTSALGNIEITAPSISVRNSVRVFNTLTQEDRQDVRLHATNGPLEIDDAVTAINGITLRANGANGNISGNTRVISDVVTLDADGDVEIATKANLVEVTAGGSVKINEQTAAAFEVRDSPNVSLTVGGQDYRKGEAVSPALYADIYDADQVWVSAENGSIDVMRIGGNAFTLGDRDGIIAASVSEPMVAGGSSVIRADRATEIRIVDAPVAASGAQEVRFVTTETLPASPDSVFVPSNRPGVYPSELSTLLEMTDGELSAINNIKAIDLRLGDRILIKDGLDGYLDPTTGLANENIINGIYVIREIDFISKDQVRLVMRRATNYDTTAEIGDRHYIRVTDGAAGSSSTRGKIFLTNGFDNVSPAEIAPSGALTSTPLEIQAVVPQAGAVIANAITTRPLNATYNPEEQTITAVDSGPIQNDSLMFDGVRLGTNDLVLVQEVIGDINATGLYKVSRDGTANASSRWELVRYSGFDETGDGEINTMYTGVVSLLDGTLKTRNTGQMQEVKYSSLNHAPLSFQEITNYRSNEKEQSENYFLAAGVDFNPQQNFQTVIGTANPFGEIVYEVASEAGTNSAPGSLGKMVQLVQQNAAFNLRNGERLAQSYSTEIADNVRSISLLQSLPVINTPITLLSETGLSLDGSRVEETADGGVVRAGGLAKTLYPLKPSTARSSRRLVRDARAIADLEEVHGIEVGPGGSGTVISQISVGGFRNGAAIKIAGAEGVLIEDVVLGVAPNGSGKTNKYGLLVEQESGAENARDTTLLDSVVAGNVEAGVKISPNVSGVKFVGNQIGFAGQGNDAGFLVDSISAMPNYIGVTRVLPTDTVSGLSITPTSQKTVTVDKNFATELFQAGVELYDRESNRTWRVEKIEEINEFFYSLTISDDSPVFLSQEIGRSLSVEAGYFADVISRGERLRLPPGVSLDKIYIGQEVRSTVADILPTGTKIAGIDRENDAIFIRLTQPAAGSAVTGLLFEVPARNVIEGNLNGIVLESGASKITASDIQQSSFDGIRINGVAEDGEHFIGGARGTALSGDNVSLNANGQSGINFTTQFFKEFGSTDDRAKHSEKVVIQGNFLGTNVNQVDGLSNGADGQSNIIFGKDTDGSDPSKDLRDELTIGPNAGNSDAPENRSSDGRYIAKYRPEDNPLDDETLQEYESLDLEGNLHFTGDPADIIFGGGGFTGGDSDDEGWWNNLPTLR